MFSGRKPVLSALLLAVALLLLASCAAPAAQQETTETEPRETELVPGVFVVSVFSYSGPYPEDGSGEMCERVVAVTLLNRSDVHYEYLSFTLETSGGVSTFEAATLFAGSQMVVVSKEKTPFADDTVRSHSVLKAAPFTVTPSVHTESLEITCAKGFITVRNLTKAPLANVYVYYKQKNDQGWWFGGITRRVAFGEIAPGELVQRPAKGLTDAAQVVFSTFTDATTDG